MNDMNLSLELITWRTRLFWMLDWVGERHVETDLRAMDCDYYGASFDEFAGDPRGTGFLFVKKERIRGLWSSCGSDNREAQSNHGSDSIRKLVAHGTDTLFLFAAVAAAIEFHEAIGVARSVSRLHSPKRYWADRVKDLPGVRFMAGLGVDSSCDARQPCDRRDRFHCLVAAPAGALQHPGPAPSLTARPSVPHPGEHFAVHDAGRSRRARRRAAEDHPRGPAVMSARGGPGQYNGPHPSDSERNHASEPSSFLPGLGRVGLGSAAAGAETGVNVNRITEAARALGDKPPHEAARDEAFWAVVRDAYGGVVGPSVKLWTVVRGPSPRIVTDAVVDGYLRINQSQPGSNNYPGRKEEVRRRLAAHVGWHPMRSP